MKMLILSLLMALSLSAAEEASQIEKENDVVNFDNLKEVLKKDMLTEVVEEKKEKVVVYKEKKVKVEKSLFSYPNEADFWKFISELWLVKNATKYSWDFVHPNYGIEKSLQELMENLSIYQVKFQLIYLNSSIVPYFILPAGRSKEVIFMVSVPFIRSLDLSKREVSLLLIESLLRHEQGIFQKEIHRKVDLSFLGTNFHDSKIKKDRIDAVLEAYSSFIDKRGFQFQEQFEVTKAMDQMLKNNPELWTAYYSVLGKIDNLVKTNLLYKDYNKLYPSPEMQLKWLRPEKKFP